MVGMLPSRTLVPEFLCYLTNNGGFLLPPFTHVSLSSSHQPLEFSCQKVMSGKKLISSGHNMGLQFKRKT